MATFTVTTDHNGNGDFTYFAKSFDEMTAKDAALAYCVKNGFSEEVAVKVQLRDAVWMFKVRAVERVEYDYNATEVIDIAALRARGQ